MKEVSAEILSATAAEKSWLSVFADLVKARLTTLVLLTTLVGFYLGWPGAMTMNFVLMFNTLAATALVAAGASALNQWLEREYDGRDAPHTKPSAAFRSHATGHRCDFWRRLFRGRACLSRAGGESADERSRRGHAGQLYFYLYAAQARDVVEHGGRRCSRRIAAIDGLGGGPRRIVRRRLGIVCDFVFWQLPRFFAIAWMYRDEYEKAGFKMLPGIDPDGRRTAQQAVSNTLALLAVSLFPFVFKMAGTAYLVGAIILGVGFLLCAVQFSRQLTLVRAKQLFFASIIYLPLLLALMVWDKLK